MVVTDLWKSPQAQVSASELKPICRSQSSQGPRASLLALGHLFNPCGPKPQHPQWIGGAAIHFLLLYVRHFLVQDDIMGIFLTSFQKNHQMSQKEVIWSCVPTEFPMYCPVGTGVVVLGGERSTLLPHSAPNH